MENGKTMDLDQQKAALDKRITYFIDEGIHISFCHCFLLLELNDFLFLDNQYLYDEEDKDDEGNASESDQLLQEKEATEPKRNLYHEENKQGSVLWKNYVAYYKYTGGIAVLLFTVVLFLLCQVALSYSDKLLSVW